MDRPISVPFVIIEFGDSKQLEEKMAIEKYLLCGWAGGILGLFHIKMCVCVCVCVCESGKGGSEAAGGWGVFEVHRIRGNVKVSFYLCTEQM